MRSENVLGKWYSSKTRLLIHLLFWIGVLVLYFFTYERLVGKYYWIFTLSDFIVTASLFYLASWIMPNLVAKGKIVPTLLFSLFAYFWWVNFNYFACKMAINFIPPSEERIYNYFNIFLGDGYLGVYKLEKIPDFILDFLFLVSLPLSIKLTKVIFDDAYKLTVSERDRLSLERDKMTLERDNLKLELEILKSQVAPHFLFNTLNSIYRLAEKDSPKTAESIMQLSNMLGYTLYQTDDDKIYLSKEIQFLRAYLNLITTKFEQYVKLDFQIDEINDPYWIVPLMLLPFIENAIKHGPERSRINAWIKISLGLNNGILNFVVANGVNRDSKEPPKGGIGLQNVKRRLELKYSNKYSLDIKEEPDSYTVFLKIDMNN